MNLTILLASCCNLRVCHAGDTIFQVWLFTVPLDFPFSFYALCRCLLLETGQTHFLFILLHADQTWGPAFHVLHLFLDDHFSVRLSLVFVSLRSLVGAERWQKCVRIAQLSAFLMRLKHGGSAYYGDERIQEGQKVTDLVNRGPLLFFFLLHLTFFAVSFSPNTLQITSLRCTKC